MSEDDAERWQMTPLQVVAKALRSAAAAEKIMELLHDNARLRLAPGEVGVIVFPAEGAAFFEVAEEPGLQGGAESVLHDPPEAQPTWEMFRRLLAERFAHAERTVALHIERSIYHQGPAGAVLHDVALALANQSEGLCAVLFPAVAERAGAAKGGA